MTAKQLPGIYAPDGSLYITLTDGAGNLVVPGSGTGDVAGPGSAVDSRLAAFDGTTGKLIKDSGKASPTGVIVGTTDSQALSNKSVSLSGLLDIPSVSVLTIATDAITVTGSHHIVDTEAAAATDNLATISGGNEGSFLILRTNSSGRDVTVKNGTGNIFCGADRVLDTTLDRIFLIKTGSNWLMVCFSDNG